MASKTASLAKQGVIHPPGFLPDNVQYETIMGSYAYAVSGDTSDVDLYGFCIPPKDIIFPHLQGIIPGFGSPPPRFDQYQQHHIKIPGGEKEYDISIYNIVKYFQLCLENNPNMIDSLFTAERCVLHCTKIGTMVRDSRKMFLHRGAWPKFRGYAKSQLHKMRDQKREGKRKELFEKHGYDIKFAYHTVRLLLEAEMILEEGDLDLERHNEHLKDIRRGLFKEEEIISWAGEKDKHLEKLFQESKLPLKPPEAEIKALLLSCLEEHYGSLKDAYLAEDRYKTALRQIREVIGGVKDL